MKVKVLASLLVVLYCMAEFGPEDMCRTLNDTFRRYESTE